MQPKTVVVIWAVLLAAGCADAVDWAKSLDPSVKTTTDKPAGKPKGGQSSKPGATPQSTATACPGPSQAAYAALEKAPPLPPAGADHNPTVMQRWVKGLEAQIGELKDHLRGSLRSQAQCHTTGS